MADAIIHTAHRDQHTLDSFTGASSTSELLWPSSTHETASQRDLPCEKVAVLKLGIPRVVPPWSKYPPNPQGCPEPQQARRVSARLLHQIYQGASLSRVSRVCSRRRIPKLNSIAVTRLHHSLARDLEVLKEQGIEVYIIDATNEFAIT